MSIKFKSIDDCIHQFLLQSQPSGIHGKVCFEGRSFYSWGYEICRILDNRQALLLNIREIPGIGPRRHVSYLTRPLRGETNGRGMFAQMNKGLLATHTCIPVGSSGGRKQVAPTPKRPHGRAVQPLESDHGRNFEYFIKYAGIYLARSERAIKYPRWNRENAERMLQAACDYEDVLAVPTRDQLDRLSQLRLRVDNPHTVEDARKAIQTVLSETRKIGQELTPAWRLEFAKWRSGERLEFPSDPRVPEARYGYLRCPSLTGEEYPGALVEVSGCDQMTVWEFVPMYMIARETTHRNTRRQAGPYGRYIREINSNSITIQKWSTGTLKVLRTDMEQVARRIGLDEWKENEPMNLKAWMNIYAEGTPDWLASLSAANGKIKTAQINWYQEFWLTSGNAKVVYQPMMHSRYPESTMDGVIFNDFRWFDEFEPDKAEGKK